MQNTKDTFYITLRDRLAALNPNRTILLRGAVRPGILVEEAEAPFAQPPDDVFILRWQNLGVDSDKDAPLTAQECEILYQTCGSQSFGGLDRGRILTAMDQELASILQPFRAPKYDYTLSQPTALATQVFWDEPVFTPTTTQRDHLTRSAKVLVYAYQEGAE